MQADLTVACLRRGRSAHISLSLAAVFRKGRTQRHTALMVVAPVGRDGGRVLQTALFAFIGLAIIASRARLL